MWTFSNAILWFQRKETPRKAKVVGSGEVCWGCTNPAQLFTPKVRGCCRRVWQKCHLRIELQWALVTWLAAQTGSMCLVPELPAHTSSPLATPRSPPSHVWKSAKSFPSSDSKLSSIFLITQFQQEQWLIFYFSFLFLKLQWVFAAVRGLFIAACGVELQGAGATLVVEQGSRTHKFQ